MEELFILSQTEFQILAASRGIRRFFGVKSNVVLDETMVLYQIHEMAQRGILTQNGEGFEIQETYRNLMDGIKNATKLLVISDTRDTNGNVCIYKGEKIVCLEESPRDEDSLRLGIFEGDDLSQVLRDRELLPENSYDSEIMQIQDPEQYREEILAADPLVSYEVMMNDAEIAEKQIIEVVMVLGQYWIRKQGIGESIEIFGYDRQQMCETLQELL